MHEKSGLPAMSQKIFKLGLSMETISVYLLCCAFSDTGSAISTKKLQETWNGSKDALINGLDALEKRNILVKIISDTDKNKFYRLAPANQWGKHTSRHNHL